jgi:hypothetical protein
MIRPLYPRGKSSRYPFDRRLGGPQSRSGRGGEEKNSQPLPGLESPIIQSEAQRYTAKLTRLRDLVNTIMKFQNTKSWKFLDLLSDYHLIKKELLKTVVNRS